MQCYYGQLLSSILDVSEAVKRSYRSPARAAGVAATRSRVREAAARLFTAQGYVATTMRQVAREAGVGERTLYDGFATKAALFGHTLGVAVAGDEEPVAVAQRPWLATLVAEPDPIAALRLLAASGSELLERAGDLIMVSIEAAGADPDMRAAAHAGARATYDVQLTVAANLSERGALRDGMDPAVAADILYTLLAPHTHQLLRRHRQWSAGQYREWIHRAMVREVLAQRFQTAE